MDKLVAIVSKVPTKVRYDDDVIDRLNNRYTVLVMVVFAALSTMQQYVGRPITCWAPKEFTGSHTKYTNSYCWVKNTYWLPFEHEIPKPHEHHKRGEIIYYQWMPFIFLIMAFFFYVPSQMEFILSMISKTIWIKYTNGMLIWTSFNSKSGVDSDNILAAARSLLRANQPERRDKMLRLITNQIDRFLGNRSQLKTGCSLKIQKCLSSVMCGKRFGNYLLLLYLLTKMLYIANSFGQLFVLNSVLRTEYNLYGYEVLRQLVSVREPEEFLNSTIFPKVTMCDFNIRRLGNVHRYTVQCLLPINLYTEKMFIFAWFWMMLVLFLNSASLFQWLLRSLCSSDRLRYVHGHLVCARRVDDDADPSVCDEFVHEYLRHDGVFLLRLIGHNTDMITVNDVVGSLWDRWVEDGVIPKKAAIRANGTRPRGTPPPPPPLKTPPDMARHGFNHLTPSAPLDEPDNGTVYTPTTEDDVC